MISSLFLAAMLGELQRADARVAAIAWRLQTANAAICGTTEPLAGFSIQTLDQYAPAARAQATAAFGLRDLPQVSAVVPGSAAARAGLVVGDEIARIDGVATMRSQGGKPTYSATAATEAALASALAAPPVRLTLRSRALSFAGDAGCPSQVQLVPEATLDASADGHYVQISGPMYEFAADDRDLAFVIAHELAHNLFAEAKLSAGGGSRQRAAELAADRFAVALMARAGYAVDGVPSFLDRLRRKRALSWLDGTHPQWKPRIAAAIRSVAEVESHAIK